ncbi:SDR family oxidoreductase, partial [Rhodococcus hoagii]|nr:SDR family oxidoreductase [Prescottella equi]
ALNVCRAVVPHMRESGGSIVNQSSTAAWVYSNFYVWRRSGSTASPSSSRSNSAGRNIRINAIAPGPIDTEATRKVTPGHIVAPIW